MIELNIDGVPNWNNDRISSPSLLETLSYASIAGGWFVGYACSERGFMLSLRRQCFQLLFSTVEFQIPGAGERIL